MLAPAVPTIMVDMNNDSTFFATFVVSVFVLGFAVGPLFIAPLSELYGRVVVYNSCNVIFFAFTIMCATAHDSGTLLAARFWAGAVGVAPITCGGASIAELLPREQRGRAMAMWSVGPLMGPVFGPVVGGFLVEGTSWRWIFWLIAILVCSEFCFFGSFRANCNQSGVTTCFSFVMLNETYAPVLLERKAARLRKETGNPGFRSKLASDKKPSAVIREAIERPLRMLLTVPIVSVICTYVAFMYGCLYILYCTFTFVFESKYNFSTSASGLSYLGSAVGSFIGLGYGGFISDWHIKKIKESGQEITPEHRLPFLLTLPGALCFPAGFFLYGWSAQYQLHWIVPEIGSAIIGFGMLAIFMSVQTYLIDAYTVHAASVMAANNVLRNVLGAFLPLFSLKMYDSMGLGWGNSLLAFVALAMAPLPIIFKIYGQRLRALSPIGS